MKKIKVKSKELVKLLKDQKEVNDEITKIHKVLSDADKKHKKLQFKVQRLKDKGAKILDKVLLKQNPLSGLEFSTTMNATSNEDIEIDILDQFKEAFSEPEKVKEQMLEQKKKKEGIWKEPKMFTGHKK